MLNANVEITHNRLVTLENRTSMMAKTIMPVLKDLKLQINKTNKQLASQYRMMSNRYNLLLRQMHEMQTIHHFALLLFKNYLTICHATRAEEDPMVTQNIRCVWQGGGVALIQTK